MNSKEILFHEFRHMDVPVLSDQQRFTQISFERTQNAVYKTNMSDEG